MLTHLTLAGLAMLFLVSAPPARLFSWNFEPEPDLAGFHLSQKVGPCLNNTHPWEVVKTFGVVDHGRYAPPTYGTYCFKVDGFDTSGNISNPSNRVQLN